MAQRLIDAEKVIEMLNALNGTAELDAVFEVIENAETVLTIPDNPTGGDMIKAMYHPYRVFAYMFNVYVYQTQKDFIKNDYQMSFDAFWWYAPWKRGDTE